MKKIALFVLMTLSLVSNGQTDTLNVLSYNLLNFPNVAPERIDTLRGILQHAKPDILMVCELTSSAGADDILFNALNVGGETSYAMANYVSGPNTENMLYYNSDKLGLKEQNEIPTALRDINEYVLFYKSTDLATTTDTTFFYVYVCHLKASTGFEAERNAECTELKNYMATRPNRQNVLIGGDFNFYGSDTEPGWNTLLSGSGVSIVDPINSPGHWNSNIAFKNIHTQSTRSVSLNGGATGGCDDRFDFIFMSPDLNGFGNDASYIAGTYKAYGQDGLHYNVAFIDAPWNTTLPPSVIWNLYHMSDHLPVYMEIEVNLISNSVPEILSGVSTFYNSEKEKIQFQFLSPIRLQGKFLIYDLSGKNVKSFDQLDSDYSLNVTDLDTGVYILRLEQYDYSMKFVR
jgi:endonuclease/exonuclease/phosphatase family metal-dependent hydrolase